MSQKLYNRYTMQSAVRSCMQKNKSKWEHVAPVAESMNFIEPRLDKALNIFDAKEDADTTGFTVSKNELLDSICERTWLLGKRLTVFARKKRLTTMLIEVNQPQSHFNNGPEIERIARCNNIINHAERHLPELAEYKIVMADIASLNADIETLRPLSSQRDTIGDEHQTLTSSLPDLLQEVQNKLYELDDEVIALLDDDPVFQDTYFNSRKITDRRAHHA
jgi:ElaB/YqjD/DUF883 family membrane-anchored ribosome-binding protein